MAGGEMTQSETTTTELYSAGIRAAVYERTFIDIMIYAITIALLLVFVGNAAWILYGGDASSALIWFVASAWMVMYLAEKRIGETLYQRGAMNATSSILDVATEVNDE